MNLLAGAFAGFGMLISSIFGGHHAPPQNQASTTPGQYEGTSTTEGRMRMGSTTMNRIPPVVAGKVVSVSGSMLTVSGHATLHMMNTANQVTTQEATTTYTVDASAAKILKFGKGIASSTPISVSDIVSGDSVVVIGTLTGTSVTASTVVDGMPPIRKQMPSGMVMPMNKQRMSTSTRP